MNLASAIVAALVLLGCASSAPQVSDKPLATAPIAPTLIEKPASVLVAPPQAAPEKAQDQIAPDGTVAEFIADSAGLSEHAFMVIANLSESAAKAKLVEIIGYCDKRYAGKSAKSVALARAAAVRDELTKLGVPARKIRLKFVTTEARNAVVVDIK